MDPGYYSADNPLQQGLRGILKQDPFRSLLVDKTATRAYAGDRIRVALVDLSGRKLFKPLFAGYGSTVPMGAASLAKVLALYGAFQLRFDPLPGRKLRRKMLSSRLQSMPATLAKTESCLSYSSSRRTPSIRLRSHSRL